MADTTIRLETKVKLALDKFKNAKRESYSDTISRLISIAGDEDSLSAEEISQIERSLEDIKKGRVLSLKEAEKKWGI